MTHQWTPGDTQLQVVRFRTLEKYKEDAFCLELSNTLTCSDVKERVARHLGLGDSTKIRFTAHNHHAQQPRAKPDCFWGNHLSDMLGHKSKRSDILHYEVVDASPISLFNKKIVNVAFHHATKAEVSIHSITLTSSSTVGDLLDDLKKKVELSHPNAELRLLQISSNRIRKIYPLHEKTNNINIEYWTLRAEEIQEEEKNLGPRDHLIYVYHFEKDTHQSMGARKFGDPFVFIIREGETLPEIKRRIQKKLNVPDCEFSKWKFAFMGDKLEYLQDSDVVFNHFREARAISGRCWKKCLGIEHSYSAYKRAYAANQVEDEMVVAPLDYGEGQQEMEDGFPATYHSDGDDLWPLHAMFSSVYCEPIPVQLEPVTIDHGKRVENHLCKIKNACLDDQINEGNDRQQGAVANTGDNVTEQSSSHSWPLPVESLSAELSTACKSLIQESHATKTFCSSKSKHRLASDDDQIEPANDFQLVKRQKVGYDSQKILRKSSSTSPSMTQIFVEESYNKDHMVEKEAEELQNASLISGNENDDASKSIGDEEFRNPDVVLEGKLIGRGEVAVGKKDLANFLMHRAPLAANIEGSKARHHVMKDLLTDPYQAHCAIFEVAEKIESETKADKLEQWNRHLEEIEEKETIIATLKDNLKAALGKLEEHGEQIRRLTEEKDQALQGLEQMKEARENTQRELTKEREKALQGLEQMKESSDNAERELTEVKRTYQRDLQQLKEKSAKAKETLEENLKQDKEEAIKQLEERYLQNLCEMKGPLEDQTKREKEAVKQLGEQYLQNMHEVKGKLTEEKEQALERLQKMKEARERELTDEKEKALQGLELMKELRENSERELKEVKKTYQRDLQELKEKSAQAKETLEETLKREKDEAIKQLEERYLQNLHEVKGTLEEKMKREEKAVKQLGEHYLQNLHEVRGKLTKEKEQALQHLEQMKESRERVLTEEKEKALQGLELMKELKENSERELKEVKKTYQKDLQELEEKSAKAKETSEENLKREKEEAIKQLKECYLQSLHEVKEKAKEEKEQLIQQHQHEMGIKEKTLNTVFSNVYGKRFQSEVEKILKGLVDSGKIVWVRRNQ